MKLSQVTFGCDPELFIRSKESGAVVGSEKVIGSSGFHSGYCAVVVDGVQVELNPTAHRCREVVISSIRDGLRGLQNISNSHYKLDFSRLVEVGINEYESLSEGCKKFGCKPSFNVNEGYPEVATVDPSQYMLRSAGGHIHLGSENEETFKVLRDFKRLVPVLDVLVGNTSVLLDRDEGNIERRKNYGRAGEYRTPKYGIEYRTLSNFWLTSPTLASLVFGLCRHGVDIVLSDLDKELMSLVDYNDVVTAINNNDYDLALSNFNKIKDFICATVDKGTQEATNMRYPLDSNTIEGFERLTQDGIGKFGTNILANWESYIGFHDYIVNNYKN